MKPWKESQSKRQETQGQPRICSSLTLSARPFPVCKLHVFSQLCHTRVLWCGIILGLFFCILLSNGIACSSVQRCSIFMSSEPHSSLSKLCIAIRTLPTLVQHQCSQSVKEKKIISDDRSALVYFMLIIFI